jgi:hypothetical protein
MKPPDRVPLLAVLGLTGLLGYGSVQAQVRNPVPTPPFELRQDLTAYNLQSTGGVPISSTPGDPPGSNGRAPTPEQQRADGLTELPATPRQFQGRITFGALVVPRSGNLNSNLSYVANAGAANLDLPRGEVGGQLVVVMPRALVGAPWLSRSVSFLFGAPIPPPLVDVNGDTLPAGTLPQDYWAPEPHRPSRLAPHEIVNKNALAAKLQAAADPVSAFVKAQLSEDTRNLLTNPAHPDFLDKLLTDLNALIAGPSIYSLARFTNVTLSLETQILDPAGTSDARPARLNRLLLEDAYPNELARTAVHFYWSPHARTAYAIQPGPVDVVWRKAAPTNAPPADFAANPGRYWVDSGNYYTLYRARYVVSGSPVKPPRKIYWTEGVFRPTGKPVVVPPGRVSVVNVIYNNNFPRRVETPYRALGQTPVVEDPNAQLDETRTLWYESARREILAYNVEGRVFVELLGETEAGGRTRRPLGFEVVDVVREPQPADVTTELGEPLTAYAADENQDDSALYPEPVAGSQDFVFQQFISDAPRPVIYATRETRNRNDVQVHWLEAGIEGLRWPFRFVRYQQVWPVNIHKYSHYLRPRVSSESDARATAVQLPAENAPVIDYQDPLDQPRAKLTETFAFYTFLTDQYPVHRTLLRFRAGEAARFERVLSWLDAALKTPELLTGSAVSNLMSGLTVTDPSSGTPVPVWDSSSRQFRFPEALPLSQIAPRVEDRTVAVGDRILAPAGETGADGGEYLAGYIRQSAGTAFHPGAYLDPFAAGFEAANRGAIIPVNAAPGNDRLEVWWFRATGLAPAQLAQGFKPVFWPAVLGRYTLRWPERPREIVLASNDGSGPLQSLEARGRIYYQNDRRLPGFNPNEEHALMQGGQAYALRDDLNITSGPNYTSEPYVLLEYTAADNRPAMTVFKVLRERPETGDVFDYVVEAGTVLQPPMPLPLLDLPLAPKLIGAPPRSLNREIRAWQVTETAVQTAEGVRRVTLTTDAPHGIGKTRLLSLQDPDNLGQPVRRFLVTEVDYTAQTLGGVVLARDLVGLTAWSGTPASEFARRRFGVATAAGLEIGTVVLAVDPRSRQSWRVEVMNTGQEGGAAYVDLQFSGTEAYDAGAAATLLAVPDNLITAGRFNNWRLGFEPLPTNVTDPTLREQYAAFTLQDRKGNLWVYRGPHAPDEHPTMAMRFYYKTLPGFFFPTLRLEAQPPVGTITPYLRPRNGDGTYAGDPVYGNRLDPQGGDNNALLIHYSPVWPANTPVLQMAETLTLPKRGLPAVRGQTSLQVVYQQSQVTRTDAGESVVLHDPTREKVFELGPAGGVNRLGKIPDSTSTTTYRGKTYFPNLPPHLSERFYFDPNRGEFGALVFVGEFRDEPTGDDFLLLNVLGASDRDRLKNLCLPDDPERGRWEAAIDGLGTDLWLFVENPARPGTYYPRDAASFGPADLARINDDDQAVDSYALTAVGPGTGYVTLIAGNGLAFTPPAEPVSVHIIKVVDTLYRGEVKVVASSNPLSEILTLQQVVDLAGRTEDYNFEWKIAAPVDGLPPDVYQSTSTLLLGDGVWEHLPFPQATDRAANVNRAANERVVADVTTSVAPRQRVPFVSVSRPGDLFHLEPATGFNLQLLPGTRLFLRDGGGREVGVTVHGLSTATQLVLEPEAGGPPVPADFVPLEAYEQAVTGQPQSIVFREFDLPATTSYGELWLSLDLDAALGARVYLDGQPVVQANLGADDTPRSSPPGIFFPLSRAYRLDAGVLAGGQPRPGGLVRHLVAVELFSTATPDARLAFNLRLEASEIVDVTDVGWLPLDAARFPDGVRALLGGQADVRALSDNYLIMRYQAKRPDHASFQPDPNDPRRNLAWSRWTRPQLAEGWIKRVLAGINPFNQRVADLFANQVNTDVSIIQQAGPRWEGDVALNLDSLNQFGLIEIYETVLRRGRRLSIDAGINYGPANDALLLAAGYLNDLYMMLGNEAWADAANPTIGIGTKDRTYGEIATALFAFRGQVPSLLEEELALLRGRDDFLLPGVEIRPVYNRLYWNYTRGIDAGEVIYALNYNILDLDENGRVDADDARRLYPQGHGDAYGHYLTALKGYYSLLMNTDFDWVPRIEAVLVLGQPVSVDYQDERKFAAAAAAVARAGKQILDLTWRRDYRPGPGLGWKHLAESRVNSRRFVPTSRDWGVDHWATRTGQGAFLHWVVGNAILPDHDPDPTHEGGIQQVDRTKVVELLELPAIAGSLQTTLDNAEAGMNPLGLPDSAVPFDLNPTQVVGAEPRTHFEQVYDRALRALQNALAAFDDAKDVTRLMRSEEDSLADFRTMVNRQELAYTNQLIELYGTPYPDDIGPGKTYRTGYPGPDLVHYMYVDLAELSTSLLDPASDAAWRIDTQTFVADWVDATNGISDFNFITKARVNGIDLGLDPDPWAPNYTNNFVEFVLPAHGFFGKPAAWKSRRASPGRIQQAISDIIKARNAAYLALYNIDAAKGDLDWALAAFERQKDSHEKIRNWKAGLLAAEQTIEVIKGAVEIVDKILDATSQQVNIVANAASESLPTVFVAGLASGGDLTAPARAALKQAGVTFKSVVDWKKVATFAAIKVLETANETTKRWIEFDQIEKEEWNQSLRDATSGLRDKVYGVQNLLPVLNARLQELDDAQRKYRALLAEGDRIQEERRIFRQRAAAVIQGFRTRDAAFRIFRNEKLERYKALYDLAAQYTFMAAKAFDYETGLLHTDQGRRFVSRAVNSRALGVVRDGVPQFAGGNTGDPGLSSVLAEMQADWQVLKGRLGFNNPDAYGTTVSLRQEFLRLLPGAEGDQAWKDYLAGRRMAHVLDDPDVSRYCLQIDPGNGLTAPGLVIEFSTTIAEGLNLFGRPLAAGDHAFSPSSFATKIHAVGVALEGYRGMDSPAANQGAVGFGGGVSPSDPATPFLDPLALSATPYVYLVPAGLDSMRSPPLGDQSVVRTWAVDDVAVPLPFNIGGSDFSTFPFWRSAESLTEPLFAIRKHQAFRPVASASLFPAELFGPFGQLQQSQYTNRRLIGRSVWNSRWKLVIPGRTLLHDPEEGLDRFIQTVRDIKLRLVTYSYAGN